MCSVWAAMVAVDALHVQCVGFNVPECIRVRVSISQLAPAVYASAHALFITLAMLLK